MNGYNVEWTRDAEEEPADIWINAADRQAVTRAEAAIQGRLRVDPLNSGTDVSEGLRRLIVPPLRVYYSVDGTQHQVEVSQVVYVP
jgi:hypothetical protein